VNGVEEFLGQTKIDRLVFALDLKTDQPGSGKIVVRQVRSADERCRRAVALKAGIFFFEGILFDNAIV
jgi:hypothetical protein